MSRKPFDQNPVVPFARPASADLNLITSYSRQALMYFLQQLYSRRAAITNDSATPQGGFIGEAFKVRALDVPVLAVSLSAGLGFQYAPSDVPTNLDSGAPNGPIAGLDDLSGYKPLVNPTALNIPIYTPLPGVGNSRYDIIEVRFRREFTDYSQDLVFDPIANDFLPKSVPQALTWAMDLNQIGYVLTPSNSTLPVGYKVGAEALTGTQVEPSVTPGYTRVSRILVSAGDTSITNLRLLDARVPAGTVRISGLVKIPTSGTPLPILGETNAPAGLRFSIRGTGAADGLFTLIIYTGDAIPFGFSAGAIAVAPVSAAGVPQVVQAIQPIYGVVGTTAPFTQAYVNNAANVAPVWDVANGQRFIAVGFQAATWNTGTQQFDEVQYNPTQYSYWVDLTF